LSKAKHIADRDIKDLDKAANAVCAVTGIKPEDIRSKTRLKHIANARFLFCLVVRNWKTTWTGAGMTKITGKYLERDHSSIVHAIHTAQSRVNNELHTSQQYSQIIRMLAEDYDEDLNIREYQTQIRTMKLELDHKDKIIADLHDAVRRWRMQAQGKQTKVTSGLFGEPKYN